MGVLGEFERRQLVFHEVVHGTSRLATVRVIWDFDRRRLFHDTAWLYKVDLALPLHRGRQYHRLCALHRVGPHREHVSLSPSGPGGPRPGLRLRSRVRPAIRLVPGRPDRRAAHGALLVTALWSAAG